jgi:hypothetical protein
MHVVTLTRNLEALEEIYGRVSFDGTRIRYDGLTCIFCRRLERGIVGQQNRLYKPADGMDFLRSLKHEFADDVLRASDIVEC